MTHKTTQRAALKGWTAQQIAERWDITPRSFSRRAAQASPMFIDAIEGLPVQLRHRGGDYDETALRELTDDN